MPHPQQDALGVTFNGSRRLLEYELVEETMTEETDEKAGFMQVSRCDDVREYRIVRMKGRFK